ncbi:hypothetical protein KIW84_042839 [Lathyrus oleraceus]|uniref:Retrovirus-related Pol polyprotein from transposon TNT 1-94-like beta-barrel domain-containing protein n=1 Tax=Pisum sativum TaxID=3888 RepID=A0A9D5AT35_PEA|nr:hypothetical protein KIW84_042839 [Pisum sativum]
MRKIEDGNVSFGDASKVKVEGKGTIRYLQKDGLIGSIQDVYYVPNLKTNILSLGQLTEKGYSILMKERILYLKDKLGHLIARVEMERNRMYKLNLINVREKCLQVNVEDKASLWHLRFGHLHHAGLRSHNLLLNSHNITQTLQNTTSPYHPIFRKPYFPPSRVPPPSPKQSTAALASHLRTSAVTQTIEGCSARRSLEYGTFCSNALPLLPSFEVEYGTFCPNANIMLTC